MLVAINVLIGNLPLGINLSISHGFFGNIKEPYPPRIGRQYYSLKFDQRSRGFRPPSR